MTRPITETTSNLVAGETGSNNPSPLLDPVSLGNQDLSAVAGQGEPKDSKYKQDLQILNGIRKDCIANTVELSDQRVLRSPQISSR